MSFRTAEELAARLAKTDKMLDEVLAKAIADGKTKERVAKGAALAAKWAERAKKSKKTK